MKETINNTKTPIRFDLSIIIPVHNGATSNSCCSNQTLSNSKTLTH